MKRGALIVRLSIPLLLILLSLLCVLLPPMTRGERAVQAALLQLNKPYVFGEAGPERFDCSGLVQYCYAPLGIRLAHSAEDVGYDDRLLTVRRVASLCPGDLIFFDTVNDHDLCDHVGLWLGGNRFVHASSAKGKVIISEYDAEWAKCFSWGKRVVCPFF